ncbi:MAG: hypothetical protein U5P41_07340 [Gammaproteobacteria bacterium]|nr:hypothetical protein [Gammaproteobacteria bacterium]
MFLRSVDESPLREKDKGAFADTFFDPAFIAARAVRITDTLLAELDQSAAAPDNKPEADS